jgi:hypothetical protein
MWVQHPPKSYRAGREHGDIDKNLACEIVLLDGKILQYWEAKIVPELLSI